MSPMRIILVLAIALQGLMGLRGMACAGTGPAPVGMAHAQNREVCPCCAGDEGSAAECHTAMPAAEPCQCSGAQPEPRPTSPAPEHKDLQFSLAWLPVSGPALPDLARRGRSPRAAAESSPLRSACSVRPLLCVWVE